jgi:23S rRNA (cytosine1962-C5)-methyltransferase
MAKPALAGFAASAPALSRLQPLLDCIAGLPLPGDAQRLFHGRGQLHPGCEAWTLDWFAPVWLLTSFEPVEAATLQLLHEALAARWAQLAPGQPLNAVFQRRLGGHSPTQLLAGCVPDPHVVHEGGARYNVHLLRGQNHGLFLDMAAGRRWVRAHCASHPGLRVLNLFAYTCAFSVAALQGGAAQVVNLDMARGALATGQRNHALNALDASRASFLGHDLFNSWGKVTRGGPYGLVIADPPSYQKGSFVAAKDYARLLRRLPELLAPGGHALLCLNAPELPPTFLAEQVAALAPGLQFVERVPNLPAFADADPQRALKVMVWRAPADAVPEGSGPLVTP